jgi:uncharacterized protein (DUF433 family)
LEFDASAFDDPGDDEVNTLRQEPAYSFADVSRFIGVSPSTVRSWFVGQAKSRPVFVPASHGGQLRLSFINLVEANALAAIRRRFHVSLQKARAAVSFLQRTFKSDHPLAAHRFETDGVDLFIEKAGATISASESGQSVIRDVIASCLRRVEWDASGPARFFPHTRDWESADTAAEMPRVVVIDPTQGGGQPVIAGRGILVAVIGRRFKAGESLEDLMEDYGCSAEEIDEAIRVQFQPAA